MSEFGYDLIMFDSNGVSKIIKVWTFSSLDNLLACEYKCLNAYCNREGSTLEKKELPKQMYSTSCELMQTGYWVFSFVLFVFFCVFFLSSTKGKGKKEKHKKFNLFRMFFTFVTWTNQIIISLFFLLWSMNTI